MSVVIPDSAIFALASGASIFTVACSSGPISVGDNRVITDASGTDAGTGGGGGGGPMDAPNGAADTADAIAPRPGDLVGVTSSCNPISTGFLRSRPGATPDVSICGLSTAVFWTSGLAVLCAGKTTTTCNSMTDPQFQSTTTAKDSLGGNLDAAALPYVEVSAPTPTFDYRAAGLTMGSVVAVVYKDKLEYGILGTVGQPDVIGDASYAMANAVGLSPDPVTGGVQTNSVTYIAFKGVFVNMNENHDEAVRLGTAAASALIQADK
jgi:Fungal chitosanase of glycosyl hydrolase group 75